jgi:GH15 family glucan-1,4-alpha-glucosidase
MRTYLAHLTRDGDLHEYFDSSNGDGLGATEQGWTAAITLAIDAALREESAV